MASKKQPEPASEPGPPKHLVRWRCNECGIFSSDWIREFGPDLRTCHGVPRNAPQSDERGRPLPCGAVLTITHDERPGRMASR